MKLGIPKISIALIVISVILFTLGLVTILIQPIIGESMASSIQVVEAIVGLGSFAL